MTQQSKLNLSKKKISHSIYSIIGTSQKNIDKITNDIIYSLIDVLVEKKKLNLKNFGVFKIQYKKKRIGRNPKTLKTHEISERNVITFKTSNFLKKKINIYND